ncbi:hypothetical protein D3C86_1783850 [compost metagenome]
MQAVQGRLQGVLANRVIDDRYTLSVCQFAHTLCDVLARGNDRMRATVSLGDFSLFVTADGADHRYPKRPRPLASDQAHSAGSSVVQNRLATL